MTLIRPLQNFSYSEYGNSIQALSLDANVAGFSAEATHGTNLLAMTTGGLFFRLTKTCLLPSLHFLPSLLKQPLINGVALLSEVTAFRAVSHGFQASGESPGGEQGFLRDFVHFACLKSVGHYFQSHSAILRHVSQNLGMMLGDETVASLGFAPRNEASFAQRFLQASASNLALGFGSYLGQILQGGRLQSLELAMTRQADIINASSRSGAVSSAPLQSLVAGRMHQMESAEIDLAQRAVEQFLSEYQRSQTSHHRIMVLNKLTALGEECFRHVRIPSEQMEALFEEAITEATKASPRVETSINLWHKLILLTRYLMNPQNAFTPALSEGARKIFAFNCVTELIKLTTIRQILEWQIQQPGYEPGTPAFWDALGVQRIHFGDARYAFSNIPHFLLQHYKNPPATVPVEVSRPDAQTCRRLNRKELLKEYGLTENDFIEQKHRSQVYRMRDGLRILVIKEMNGLGNVHENDVQFAVMQAGLRQILPEACTLGGKRVLVTDEKALPYEGTHAAYFAHPRYFDYLNDESLTAQDFEAGLFRSAFGIGVLNRHGLHQTEPLVLYHHRKVKSTQRNSRRYFSSPELVFPKAGLIGMGVIDGYKASLEYPNYSVEGPRDAESIHPLEKIAAQIPQFETFKNRPQHLEAELVGDNLLALTLLIGNRMRAEAGRFENLEEMILGEENDWLRSHADLLLRTYAHYYAGRRNMEFEQALAILRPRADWLRLARQCAFYMTPAYRGYVCAPRWQHEYPTRYSREHAFSLLYGDHVQVEGMGPYKDEITHKEIPFWPEDDLGAANGAFPITEFERVWCAALFGPNMEEMRN